MQKLPKITIAIVTLNNQRTIEKCLRAIVSQDYPKKNIEYLNVDGGSRDATKSLLQKYGFKIVNSPIKKNAEAQRAVGIMKAKNNLIVSIDADNYLPNKYWLREMVRPFMDDPALIHANTMYFTYRKTDTLFNRYNALFGAVDPIVFYMGKPDRLPQNTKKWKKGKIITENDLYYIVEFSPNSLPTVGCNGVVYKKDILLKYAQSSPDKFLHIDVFMDLLQNGYNKFAIVKNSVIHDTATSLNQLMKKRVNFLSNYYLNSRIKRRYFIYNPSKTTDNLKLSLFVLYTVTFIKPTFDSFLGFSKIPDLAWFLHPVVCWIYLYSYSIAVVKRVIYKNKSNG